MAEPQVTNPPPRGHLSSATLRYLYGGSRPPDRRGRRAPPSRGWRAARPRVSVQRGRPVTPPPPPSPPPPWSPPPRRCPARCSRFALVSNQWARNCSYLGRFDAAASSAVVRAFPMNAGFASTGHGLVRLAAVHGVLVPRRLGGRASGTRASRRLGRGGAGRAPSRSCCWRVPLGVAQAFGPAHTLISDTFRPRARHRQRHLLERHLPGRRPRVALGDAPRPNPSPNLTPPSPHPNPDPDPGDALERHRLALHLVRRRRRLGRAARCCCSSREPAAARRRRRSRRRRHRAARLLAQRGRCWRLGPAGAGGGAPLSGFAIGAWAAYRPTTPATCASSPCSTRWWRRRHHAPPWLARGRAPGPAAPPLQRPPPGLPRGRTRPAERPRRPWLCLVQALPSAAPRRRGPSGRPAVRGEHGAPGPRVRENRAPDPGGARSRSARPVPQQVAGAGRSTVCGGLL